MAPPWPQLAGQLLGDGDASVAAHGPPSRIRIKPLDSPLRNVPGFIRARFSRVRKWTATSALHGLRKGTVTEKNVTDTRLLTAHVEPCIVLTRQGRGNERHA